MSIFCNGFLTFLESIPESFSSKEEYISFVSQAIPPLAEQLGIGRLEMIFHSNPVSFEKGCKTECVVLYQHDSNYDEFSHTETFRDRQEAVVSYHIYPKRRHTWSDEEKRMLHFLTYQLFLLCTRTMLLCRIQKASITDSLTGILNTAGLIKQGNALYETGILADYTGIFLNIKGFRYLNQRFGFKYGDDAMRKFTQGIQKYLETDEYFGRLGCDNFVLLVRKEHLDTLLLSLLSIRIHVQLEDFVNTFDINSRVGIYPIRESDTINDVLNRTTVAGLLAKTSLHHNIIWFRDDMLVQYIREKEIADAFMSGLENNEFHVCYQPKVALDTQTICGCEALARWHKNGKLLQPSEFVPVLEKEGNICLLDFYVLEKLCQDIRNWLDQGLEPVRISTNFSKIHLHNKNLADDIFRILERHQVPAKYIEIELTESCGYEDFDALSDFINTMKAHGVHTSIDDFGTGYSSLNLLTNLNIDAIKLDKSFLNNNEPRSKSDEIVIKTIINLGRDLNMQVICEGIESIEQVKFLKSLHCPIVQGYLYDGPLTHDEFETCLKSNMTYHILKEG